MKISCQTCTAKYTIADEKVRGKTLKIKCKKCGSTITAGPDAGGGGEAAAAGGDWMVNVADGDQRTLTVEQIADLYAQGVVGDATYLWREGQPEWLPLAQVSEVAAAMPSPSAAAPAAEQMDDSLPTQMAFVPGAQVFGGAPRPAAGAPAARRSEPRPSSYDDEEESTRVADANEVAMATAPAPVQAARRAPAPSARPTPPAPSMVEPAMGGAANSEASGLVDIRNLQMALKKPDAPKKDERVDDIMNMGGGALFAAPPVFEAPKFEPPVAPAPEPARAAGGPVAATAPTPVVNEPPKSKAGLIVGGVLGALVLVAGTVGVMTFMNKPQPAAQADASKKEAPSGDAKAGAPEAKPVATASAEAKKAEPEKKPDAPAGEAGEKKAEPEAVAAADTKEREKEYATLSPDEKKRRDEAFKKKKEDDEKKKKEEDDKKKKAEDDKKKEAEPPKGGDSGGGGDKPFDRSAAISALNSAAGAAASCKKPDGPTGNGRIAVTFAPSGSVTTANVEGPPFAGSAVGGCVAAKFRSARVPAFSGSAVTVKKSFTIN